MVPEVSPCVFDEDGHRLDTDAEGMYSNIVWGIISDAFKYSNECSATIMPEESLMDFFKVKVEQKGLDSRAAKIVLQMARMWGDFVGEPIEKQSLKFFWLEECIEGG